MQLLVGDVIRRAAQAAPERTAATQGSNALTLDEVDRRSNQAARALARVGVCRGDRVAWWGETSLDAMPIFGGLAKLGAVFMPVNARLGAAEAADVLTHARPRLVVVDATHAPLTEEWTVVGPDRILTHEALFAAAATEPTEDVDARDLDEHDPHVIFFTSGSTGRPKGVVLSHRTSFLRSFPSLLADDGEVCVRVPDGRLLRGPGRDRRHASPTRARRTTLVPHRGPRGVRRRRCPLHRRPRSRRPAQRRGDDHAGRGRSRPLADHPGIAEVAVVGIPDAEWGEIVCAVVVAEPGAASAPDVDALRRHCEGRLAAYKHPRRVEVVDTLPRTAATGQVQRTLLVTRLTGA